MRANSAYTKSMYKQLLAHKVFITRRLERTLADVERRRLLRYHDMRVRDFQHERLIHLLVTFFFGCLLVGAIAALLVSPLPALVWPLILLVVVLACLELAYIRHYYLLENGVQSLYVLTERLGGGGSEH